MISLPVLSRLTKSASLNQYSDTYFHCSGLPVPDSYIQDPNNRVYGIFLKGEMIGGFILAKGDSLRTVEVFASPDVQQDLYNTLGDVRAFTEITCFWIDPAFRQNTSINTYIWLALAYSLKRFGERNILFGTCSSPLARLYGITPKSRLIHRDQIGGKRTYIFQSARKESLRGFIEIIRYKLKRTARIKKQRVSQRVQSVAG